MMLQGSQRALQSDYGVVKQVTREWHVSDLGPHNGLASIRM
jgi:hypothetical protein